MFKQPAPTAPVQSDPPPREKSPKTVAEKPTSAANLLRVIGKLIEIGRERLRAIRAQRSPEQTHILACASPARWKNG